MLCCVCFFLWSLVCCACTLDRQGCFCLLNLAYPLFTVSLTQLHIRLPASDKFKAAALRNPVTDICSMVYVTDIPDWCFVEAGLPIKPVSQITSEDMAVMKAASPLPLASNVKCPSLVLIGAKDLRVPPFQVCVWGGGGRGDK